MLSEGVKAPSVLNGGLDNFYVLLGKYVRVFTFEAFYCDFQKLVNFNNFQILIYENFIINFPNFKFKFHTLGLGSFFAVGAVLEFEYMKRKKEVK